jgi:hypothetical protein
MLCWCYFSSAHHRNYKHAGLPAADSTTALADGLEPAYRSENSGAMRSTIETGLWSSS